MMLFQHWGDLMHFILNMTHTTLAKFGSSELTYQTRRGH